MEKLYKYCWFSLTNRSFRVKMYREVWKFESGKEYIFLIINVFEQQISMISEGSCDTEDWSNGRRKYSF